MTGECARQEGEEVVLQLGQALGLVFCRLTFSAVCSEVLESLKKLARTSSIVQENT